MASGMFLTVTVGGLQMPGTSRSRIGAMARVRRG